MISAPYLWQMDQWRSLFHQFEQRRLPHALLLRGKAGIGKHDFAVLGAQALLCHNRNADGVVCDRCRSCQLFMAHTHPDFFLISPVAPSKIITIDQIRNIKQKLEMKSLDGGLKIVILSPAENMNVAAGNSLLKTLEEPTDSVHIFLVSHQNHRLLPTVRSRCQSLKFNSLDQSSCVTWLEDKVKDRELAISLMALAEGAPLLARVYADSDMLNLKTSVDNDLKALLARETLPVKMAQVWSKYPINDVFSYVINFTVDMIRLKFRRENTLLTNKAFYEFLKHFVQGIDVRRLFLSFDMLLEARNLVNGQIQVNNQFLLEDTLISWCNNMRTHK